MTGCRPNTENEQYTKQYALYAVVCQVGRGKTAKTLEDDHGKLELYSLVGQEANGDCTYRCDVVKLSGAG